MAASASPAQVSAPMLSEPEAVLANPMQAASFLYQALQAEEEDLTATPQKSSAPEAAVAMLVGQPWCSLPLCELPRWCLGLSIPETPADQGSESMVHKGALAPLSSEDWENPAISASPRPLRIEDKSSELPVEVAEASLPLSARPQGIATFPRSLPRTLPKPELPPTLSVP